MKAYKVFCDDGDHGQVVEFAERSKDVSKHATSDYCDCPWVERHVKRAAEFDKYAPGPVTVAQYLAEGWHWECGGCSSMVWGDDKPIIINGHVYHRLECVLIDRDGLVSFFKTDEKCHESVQKHWRALNEWLNQQQPVDSAN